MLSAASTALFAAPAQADAVRTFRGVELTAAAERSAAAEAYGCLGTSKIDEVTELHAARSRRRLDASL